LRQILVNLVGNAVKFTHSGHVEIETRVARRDGDQILLEFNVYDTGPGIAEDEIELIFEPFVTRARDPGKHQYGTGLGLTICKRLIEAMGGEIEIESRERGGTLARFRVPVEVRDPVVDVDAKLPKQLPTRVLVAHDVDAAAQSIARQLRAWGIDTEVSPRAGDAVHRLRSAASTDRPFDVAIVDSGLTRHDPLLCVRRIREASEIERVPAVLLVPITAQLEYGEVSALGAVRCLMKPISPIQLRYHLLKSVAGAKDSGSERVRANAGAGGKMKILIADDNVVNAKLLSRMLGAEGYDADTVYNGRAVLSAVKAEQYDLLLIDGQMPDMDGHLVAQEIRSKPERFPTQPVIIAVTADSSDTYRSVCFDVGMDGFIVKPVRMEKLRSGLVEWAERVAEKRSARIGDSIVCRALRTSIMERTGERDESFLSDYIELFLQDTFRRIDNLVAAVDARQSDVLRRECHALKGACLEFGAERMIRFCEEISSAAVQQDFAEAAEALNRLEREFARLRPVYELARTDRLH
jgi:CheY-like chemotaxis protein